MQHYATVRDILWRCSMARIKSESVRKWLRLLTIIGVIMVMSYSFMSSFKSYVEDKKREQARYNLEHIEHCLSRVERVVEQLGTAQCSDSDRLDRAIWNTCTRGMRTSSTGDVYILDKDTTEFIYDNSNDVPGDTPLYFTKDSVGELFKDWPSAAAAKLAITSGSDSTGSTKMWYNFDGAPEWLEWKTWEHDDVEYVIVQGIQKDEVYAGMRQLEYMYYMFMLIIVVILVMEVNAVPYDNRGRRGTDGA